MNDAETIGFESRVAHFAAAHGLLDSGRVLVTLSGGADSVALLRCLLALGCDCVAAHCNFGLRGEESQRDMRFAEDLCQRLEVKLVTVRFDVEEYKRRHKVSTEMACRELRYEWFERMRIEQQCSAIAVAHHADDNVETLFLNLFRGTGIAGLAGIQPRNGRIIRPLLGVGRKDVEAYLRALGQDYVTDSTNLETDFARNKIRNVILPEIEKHFPSARKGIVHTLDNLSGDFSVWRDAVLAFEESAVCSMTDGMHISREKLAACPSPTTCLRPILARYGFSADQVADIVAADRVGALFDASEWIAEVDREEIVVMPKEAKDDAVEFSLGDAVCPDFLHFEVVDNAPNFEFDKSGKRAFFDADEVGDVFTLRRWHMGDRFRPFGMKGSKKISDYFNDHKFSLAQKRAAWILEAKGVVLWIVGERASRDCSVSPTTRRILVVNDLRK